jgi:hypothetical protein
MEPMPTSININDATHYFVANDQDSAVRSALADGWSVSGDGSRLTHPADINLDEQWDDDIDFAMTDLPTRPGPCKAAAAPEHAMVVRHAKPKL